MEGFSDGRCVSRNPLHQALRVHLVVADGPLGILGEQKFPTPPDRAPGAFSFSVDCPDAADRTAPPGHHDRGPVRDPRREDRDGRHPLRAGRPSSRSSTPRWPGATCASSSRPSTSPSSATLGEALGGPVRPDGLLIGIAPTGGRLPPDWRGTILEAIAAGLDIHSGLHDSSATIPSSSPRPHSGRHPADRLPATARPDGDDHRPAAPARASG